MDDDVRALLAEHLDAVWAVVAGRVADRADVLDVVVGAFRAVAPAAVDPGAALAATARTLADRHRPTAVITRVGGPPEPAGPPTAGERAEVERRVLAASDDRAATLPARRGRWVAAGAVAVLLVGLAVVVRPAEQVPGPGPEPAVAVAARLAADAARQADAELAAVAGIPASGDLVVDQHLARCAAAVRAQGGQSRYPDPGTWRTDTVDASAGGVTSSVNGTFFCSTTPATTWVSGTSGITVGAVQLVRVGTRQLGVLNPGRAAVAVTPLRPDAPGSDATSREPTQLVLLEQTLRGPDPGAPWGLALRITPAAGATGGAFDGPLPDPGRTAIRVANPGAAPQQRTSEVDALLAACLASDFGSTTADPETWSVVTARELDDGTRLVAAGAPGMAGLCARRGDRPVFTSFPVEAPVPERTLRVVAGVGAVAGDPRGYWLLVVDPRAVTVEVTGTREPVTCLAAAGVGVCSRGSTSPDPGTMTARDADGTVVAGPVALP